MKRNLFKQALAQGRPQIGLWSTLPSPYVTELLGGSGFDWILLDAEHAPTDVPLMLHQLQALAAARPAAGAPTTPVVRPPWNDPVLIKRYLDIGAQNLLIPFVQSSDEAAAAVASCRYAPAGIRGMGGSVRASDYGRNTGYVATAERDLGIFVQIETADALEQLEAIAAVEGIDGVFIGPADLSASMGYAQEPKHPKVTAAIDDAINRIKRCKKAPGILMVDEVRARECLANGALFVAVAVDLVLLRSAADERAAFYKKTLAAAASSAY